MKKTYIGFALAALLCSISAVAQSAKVIALTPKDSETAKELQAEEDALTAKTKAFRDSIAKKYLRSDKVTGFGLFNGTDSYSIKDGWGFGGFQYSEDYKYIVPVQSETHFNGGLGCGTFVTNTVAN